MTGEAVLRWAGGLLAISVLGMLLSGIWYGTQREVGRTVGLQSRWLRSRLFYAALSLFFLGLAWLGWRPLPVAASDPARSLLLISGSLLLFPGLLVLLWGRLALGRSYYVSTGLGAQLFKGQPLVKTGPYAIVRHPMYVGLICAALGSLLVYQTWTSLYFAGLSWMLLARARREEQLLAAEFGDEWQAYCLRVPALVPRWPGRKRTYDADLHRPHVKPR